MSNLLKDPLLKVIEIEPGAPGCPSEAPGAQMLDLLKDPLLKVIEIELGSSWPQMLDLLKDSLLKVMQT